MTDQEKALAVLLGMAMVAVILERQSAEAKPMTIRPTMRPDPQAVSLSHGALISHAQA